MTCRRSERHGAAASPTGCKHDAAGDRTDDLLDLDALAQAGLSVLAQDAVHLDDALAAVLRVGRQRLGDGGPLADDSHRLAGVNGQRAHVLGVDADQAAADVPGKRL